MVSRAAVQGERATVKIIGPEKKVYKSKHGYEAVADVESSKVKAAGLDAVIIPGSYATERMRRDPHTVKSCAMRWRGTSAWPPSATVAGYFSPREI